MLVQVLRQQPRDHVEILVVMRGQPARVALGFGSAAAFRGEIARDFSSGVASMMADAERCLLAFRFTYDTERTR